jgi:hypothetical protein
VLTWFGSIGNPEIGIFHLIFSFKISYLNTVIWSLVTYNLNESSGTITRNSIPLDLMWGFAKNLNCIYWSAGSHFPSTASLSNEKIPS